MHVYSLRVNVIPHADIRLARGVSARLATPWRSSVSRAEFGWKDAKSVCARETVSKPAKVDPALDQVRTHYGTKPGHFETSKIYLPMSEGVSEVSERANE